MKLLEIFVNLAVPQYMILVIFTTVSSALVINPAELFLPATVSRLAAAIISLSFAVFGLNSLNQIFDIEIDKISKPLRPLPSGEVSAKNVHAFSLLSFLISLAIALPVSLFFASIVLLFILLSVMYSVPPLRLKRYGLSSNIIGGTLYGALPFVSAWAVAGGTFPVNFFILFYGLAISIATLKDFEDAEAEKKFGIKTLPVLLGYEKAKLAMLGMIFSLLVLMLGFSATNRILLYPTLLCFLLLYELKKLNLRERGNAVSQSENVTRGMIIIVIMELSYGLSSLLSVP